MHVVHKIFSNSIERTGDDDDRSAHLLMHRDFIFFISEIQICGADLQEFPGWLRICRLVPHGLA